MQKVFVGGVLFFAALGMSLMVACSGDSGSSGTTVSNSYGGPGSEWQVTFNSDNTFQILYYDTVGGNLQMTVNGTVADLSGGFKELIVTSATGNDAPSAGDKAHGLEIPGMVFLLKPLGSSDGEVIPMVARGSCPSTDFTANWVITGTDNSDAGATDSYGTFSFTQATGSALIPDKRRLSDYSSIATNDSVGSGTCTNGIMTLGAPANATMWLTTTGGAIVDAGNIILAMPQNTIALSDLAGNYAGVVFDGGRTGSDASFPVSLTVATGGASATVTVLDTNFTATTESVNLALSNANTDGPGFFRGQLNDGSNPATNITCMATLNANSSGKDTIFCAGLSPDDNTKLFSVVFVQI